MSDAVPAATVRGFILHPTYRLLQGRPVVHLYGVLESGQGFLVRDGRLVPHFFIEAAEAERARALGASSIHPTEAVALGSGRPVARVEVPRPADTPPLRNLLQASGIRCYEADVRFAMRFLIDRHLRGSIEIRGQPRTPEGNLAIFDDPELAPGDWVPRLRVLSFDIETDLRLKHLLSIALHGCGTSEVLLLTPTGMSTPPGAIPLAHEHDLLRTFAQRVREIDPDVLTGWNVIDFDLAFLARRAEELGEPLELGREPGALRVEAPRFRSGLSRASVPGRAVLDGLALLRSSFVRLEGYSLDAAAREVLGEGKTLAGHDRGEEIQRTFHRDRQRFVEYNLTDARLVTEILERLHLVELAVERSRLTGLPPERVAGSIAAFDSLYLPELRRRGAVAPSVGDTGSAGGPGGGIHGGHVLEPTPGLYENVLVFDFKSLYPSLIRTFQLDPLGYLPPGRTGGSGPLAGDPIVAPNGAAFRRERSILAGVLDELFPRREEAKRRGDAVAAFAIKILMNSFYGVLATSACRFHNPRVANAITSFGRELLLWSKGRIEALGHRVLYGDTDSLFVESGSREVGAARHLGETLVAGLNRDLATHIRATWGVESRLELEFETLYLRLLLPQLRGGGSGARKRYAGLVETDGGEGPRQRVVFTGMEVVRRDWTDLARRVQRELYERLFTDRPVEDYLRKVVEDLRGGRLDDLLVYRKALRKDLDAYTSTTPPHVTAARKMTGRPGRRIAYVVTTGGPEPASERKSPIDYQHYVDRQIQPVAEPVLHLLGLGFSRVVGDDRQMELF